MHIFRGRQWARWVLLAVVLLFPVAAIWVWTHRTEIAEVSQAALCLKPCEPLAPEELRLRVIKAYLHRQLDTNAARFSGGSRNWKLVLLSSDMTKEQARQSIEGGTLLSLVTTDTTVLSSHSQIDALTVDALLHNPSIAIYSLLHREVDIVPTRSIRVAGASEVETHFRAPARRGPLTFSSWEIRRGYGLNRPGI